MGKLHARGHDHSVFLHAFDLLELNGDHLRNESLETCKGKLQRLLSRADKPPCNAARPLQSFI
jgi:ATP-dependent DNA ligase